MSLTRCNSAPQRWINALEVLPSANIFATAAEDGTLSLWRLPEDPVTGRSLGDAPEIRSGRRRFARDAMADWPTAPRPTCRPCPSLRHVSQAEAQGVRLGGGLRAHRRRVLRLAGEGARRCVCVRHRCGALVLNRHRLDVICDRDETAVAAYAVRRGCVVSLNRHRLGVMHAATTQQAARRAAAPPRREFSRSRDAPTRYRRALTLDEVYRVYSIVSAAAEPSVNLRC